MQTISLSGTWRLSPADSLAIAPYSRFFLDHKSIPCVLPGDIHSALIAQQIIPDPYWGSNENDIQWVGKSDWTLSRSFVVTKEMLREGNAILSFTMADTIISVRINGIEAGTMDDMFRRYRFNITPLIHEGENDIELFLESAEKIAKERAEKLPYPIPCSVYPNSSPHRNLVRKAQCHSGWDWGPCLMVSGIYGTLGISFPHIALTDSVTTHLEEKCEGEFDATVTTTYTAYRDGEATLSVSLAGVKKSKKLTVKKGGGTVTFLLSCKDVKRWWPHGEGKQVLYPLTVTLEDDSLTKRIGFRTLVLKTETDKNGGKGMTFCVNGRDIYAKGANWIPVDALPSRITKERYEYLLQSCADANMNMLRLWGGGFFEMDAFYDLCDEKGILIWHDLMFSCSLYPSTPEFLSDVEAELRYQVPRLMDHPSLALWCGNNESLGAIGWYPESKDNPARYYIDYDRLTHGTLERVITELDGEHTFWPSSPSAGPNDFADNWHRDDRGDMHYWSVWHEGKPFEAYYAIKPRFVSEFGYQSFPSLSTVRSYADDTELSLTSPVMEHHQKNNEGNTLIITNFCRYFRFPNSFVSSLYLSQCQQALAIKMASEYWRTLRPRCMGSLYWQLNDNWPVSSWSSIEYGGKWKLLHYAARRFNAPLLPIAYRKEDGSVAVFVVNDTQEDLLDAKISVKCASFHGEKKFSKDYNLDIRKESSNSVCTLDSDSLSPLKDDCFLYLKLSEGETYIENTLLLDLPKKCNLEDPVLSVDVEKTRQGFLITLNCIRPAFWVSLDAGDLKGRFSDNWFDLRPTAQKQVLFKTTEKVAIKEFRDALQVMDLYASGK